MEGFQNQVTYNDSTRVCGVYNNYMYLMCSVINANAGQCFLVVLAISACLFSSYSSNKPISSINTLCMYY